MDLRTCVAPNGKFVYGIHKPRYQVANLRDMDILEPLGRFPDGRAFQNDANFPSGDVEEPGAEWIFEIPNAFPFRGTTYILKSWADEKAQASNTFELPQPQTFSFSDLLQDWLEMSRVPEDKLAKIYRTLPEPLQLALAVNSTDPQDLMHLAQISCEFIHDTDKSRPIGLAYKRNRSGLAKPAIHNYNLFKALANNIHLPDEYKNVMALKPGAQGNSEIVGDWRDPDGRSHVFEYLRRNSYIPWGHYAANMANDAVRYRISDLRQADITAMRHLYYQRTYVRIARDLGININSHRQRLTVGELETLRGRINDVLAKNSKKSRLKFNSTLWGWNFGFDFSPSRYRLHASNQQIHQQYALIPKSVTIGENDAQSSEEMPTYCCGDLIAEFIKQYRQQTGKDFFDVYVRAIRNNRRLDHSRKREHSLVVYEDERVMVFVPKAQTSQWELQMMTLNPVGNVLEADSHTRKSLDRAMLATMKILESMGAKMVTVFEYSKRLDSTDPDQRLLYAFLPGVPHSPGAFSEAQLRWINGHYPEDFASACRSHLPVENK
jgi:hypothetical protein